MDQVGPHPVEDLTDDRSSIVVVESADEPPGFAHQSRLFGGTEDRLYWDGSITVSVYVVPDVLRMGRRGENSYGVSSPRQGNGKVRTVNLGAGGVSWQELVDYLEDSEHGPFRSCQVVHKISLRWRGFRAPL